MPVHTSAVHTSSGTSPRGTHPLESLWVNGRPPSSLLLPATHPLVHHLVALARSSISKRRRRCGRGAAGAGAPLGLGAAGAAPPRKPFNVDVVLAGKMHFEIRAVSEFGLAYVAICLSRLPLLVVDVGKMPFEVAALYALELAHVA